MTREPLVSDPATCSANSRQHARAEEQSLAVLPLVRLTVERARSGRDGEVGDCQPVLRVAQLGVGREVAHHGDDGLAGHGTRRRPRLGGGGLAGGLLVGALLSGGDLSDRLLGAEDLGAHDGLAELQLAVELDRGVRVAVKLTTA